MSEEQANLLFVDDEQQILVSLRALFRSKYNVYTADGGANALDIIRTKHIHTVVSDQRMPKMTGHELLREIKKISPSTMRILLTGYSDMDAVIKSVNDGEVFRFISKPWNNDELRTTVDNAVQIALETGDDAADLHDQVLEDKSPVGSGDGILVINDTPDIAEQVQRLCQEQHLTYDTRNIDEALEILAHEEIAVIITDVTVAGEDTTEFVKLLKQQYPMMMTIVLTSEMDAQTAVSLINQARIFRYLTKPIGDGMLRPIIANGMHSYRANKERPNLLQRQTVESIEAVQNPSLASKIMGRLKTLRTRFRFSRQAS
ncbi:MAG: response regulator [Candidatus Tectomicrobia bacterium]|nr:response regulator [Candidatus Tectomicrobia bacterium]